MFGASNALVDRSVIRPLLSGRSATAANVTPAASRLALWNPSAKVACGVQTNSRSGAPGPEERSFTGAPDCPLV